MSVLRGLLVSKSAPWILLISLGAVALVGATRGYMALGQYKASIKALEQRLEANRSYTARIQMEAQRSAEQSRKDMQELQEILSRHLRWSEAAVPEEVAEALSN